MDDYCQTEEGEGMKRPMSRGGGSLLWGETEAEWEQSEWCLTLESRAASSVFSQCYQTPELNEPRTEQEESFLNWATKDQRSILRIREKDQRTGKWYNAPAHPCDYNDDDNVERR